MKPCWPMCTRLAQAVAISAPERLPANPAKKDRQRFKGTHWLNRALTRQCALLVFYRLGLSGKAQPALRKLAGSLQEHRSVMLGHAGLTPNAHARHALPCGQNSGMNGNQFGCKRCMGDDSETTVTARGPMLDCHIDAVLWSYTLLQTLNLLQWCYTGSCESSCVCHMHTDLAKCRDPLSTQ